MATIYAVVSPESKIHIKTEVLSPQMLTRTPGQVRPLRPINKDGEPGKVRRQLAMNANKGNPVINNRRNARERNRVKQVNHGFAFLRSHLPLSPDNKKVSKVDTLRTAIEYIQGLTDLLMDSDRYDSSSVSPGSYMLKPDSEEAMAGLVSNPPPYHHHLLPSPSAAASVFQTTPSGFCLSPASFAGFGSEALAGLTATAPLLEPPPSYNDSIRELQLSREHHQLSLVEEPSSSSAASPVTASVAMSVPEASEAVIPDHDFFSALRWWQGSAGPVNQP